MNEYKKRVYQGIICVTALTLISMPAFSAEKTDKVAPLHSFFAKTEKPKTESNVTNETTKTKKASKKEKEIKTNVKDPAIKGDCDRYYAIFPKRRRYRLLRLDQQFCNGNRADGRIVSD